MVVLQAEGRSEHGSKPPDFLQPMVRVPYVCPAASRARLPRHLEGTTPAERPIPPWDGGGANLTPQRVLLIAPLYSLAWLHRGGGVAPAPLPAHALRSVSVTHALRGSRRVRRMVQRRQ